MRLSAYATGRDNNFNLIRCVAAFAVLYSHGYALALGGRGTNPGNIGSRARPATWRWMCSSSPAASW
jgi:hypothetical protein